MRYTIAMILAALMLLATGKELRTLVLTPTPKMHCESCENKIKGNMRFEKGVSKIETNIDAQTVAITYDSKKTSPKQLQQAMKKIGYETVVVSDQPVGAAAKVGSPRASTARQPAAQ